MDSSHVQNQTGPLIKAFAKHEKDAKVNKENVQVWRDALKEVGNIPKWRFGDSTFGIWGWAADFGCLC